VTARHRGVPAAHIIALCVWAGLLRAQPTQPIHCDTLFVGQHSAGQVEYFWAKPGGPGPWPAIVFIHGHQDGVSTLGGKAFVDYGVMDSTAAHGFVAVAISQPGYGGSDGPPDFMGPKTVGAVEAVLRVFRAKSFVRRDRIALEGISRGAVVASLVAAQDPSIRAMVLISGVYDFVTPLDSSSAQGRVNIARRNKVRSDILSETDGTLGALRARSALAVVDRIRTPTLLFNGAQDDRTDPEQAQQLAERIRRNGAYARAFTYPEYGHAIPYDVRQKEIMPFFEKYLR